MANPFSDPFTNPDSKQLVETPRTPSAIPPAQSRDLDSGAFDPEAPWAVNDPTSFEPEDDTPRYRSPYAGQDLLSEPMDKEKGPTAFQRKEINWADGGENPDAPKAFPDVKGHDFLEVDYMYGSKKGATADAVLAANIFGRQFSAEELSQDEEGRKLLDLMRVRRAGTHNSGGTLGNFVKGLTDWSRTDIPFYGWVADVGASVSDAIDMSNTMKKLQNGDKVTNHEAIQLRRFMLQQELESQHTMARNVGSVVRQAVPFMAEMYASSLIGAAIGSVVPGLGTGVGAVVGAAFTPFRWIFGIGGKTAGLASRKVVNEGLQALSKKAVNEWTRSEARNLARAGVERFGADGFRKFMAETTARLSADAETRALGRRAIRNKAYQELAGELSLEQLSAKKFASRTLLSADYRQFLEQGMKQGIAEEALKRAGIQDVSKFLGKDVVMNRALLKEFDKAMSIGLKKLMEEDGGKAWKAYIEGIANGIVKGEWANGRTAQDLVRRGISEVVGNGEFISPRLAKGVADQVAKTVARNMELRYGTAAFRNSQRFWNYVAEHASRGFLQSEHAFRGMAPTIAHNGFSSFVRSSDALKEGLGRLFIEAPIQGAKQFLAGPVLAAPLIAASTGNDPRDLVVRGQLGLQINALLTGDRKNMDSAQMCALGSAFVEYMSENAGRGLGITLKGAAGLGTTVRAASAGAESVLGPVSRKAGTALDRAVTAVFGKDAFGTREGLAKKTTEFISKRLKSQVPVADIRRAIAAKSLEGLSDSAKRALEREGIRSYNGLLRAVSREAMDGNRFAAVRAYIGAKLAERGASPDEVVRKFRQFGYDGILEEMGEERLGDFIRGVFRLDDSASDAEVSEHLRRAFEGFTDPEQLATEFIGFAIPGGIRRAAISSQRWIATGALGQAREAVDRATAIRDSVRYGTAAVHVEDDAATNKARALHEQKVEQARDRALGSTEENRKKFSANAASAWADKASLRGAIQADGGLQETSESDSAEVKDAKRLDDAAVADIFAADSELAMKTALENYANGLVECETEDILEDTIRRQGAAKILGEEGLAAVRREWRKRNGHEFAADGANKELEDSLTEWKTLSQAGYESELAEVQAQPLSEDEAAQSVFVQMSTRTNASMTADQEADAGQGGTNSPFVDVHTRDVMAEDIRTIGTLMGRALLRHEEKMSFGRRAASRIVGLLGAMATGDLSLAASNPAMWLAQDRGLDPTLTRYATDAYQAAMLQGFKKVMSERGDEIRAVIGNTEIKDVASLREALNRAYDKGALRADIYEQIEAAGQETFRCRTDEFATAYMAAHGIMLFSRQDSEAIAKRIVANRHAAANKTFDETTDREEIETVRRSVVDKVIDIAKNATGVTSHAGQGQYGNFITIDVRRAIGANDSAELVSAILDSPAFRGASKLVDVSRMSEHDRENAMSLLCTSVANLNAIRRIDPDAEADITEEQLSVINEGMRINLSDYSPDEVQELARSFVRRVRLLSENMRKTYTKDDANGRPLKATLSPIGQGQYEVVLTDSDGNRVESGIENGTHDQLESALLSDGYAENEQKLVISGLSSVVSSDATSLVFFRAGQDREEVRRQFIRAQGAGLSDTTVDENRLPPYCRKHVDDNGNRVWVYSDSQLDEAVAAFRQELDMANEFEAKSAHALERGGIRANGNTWQTYLDGHRSSAEARKAREQECFAAWVKVYGENGIGYERRAAKILTDLGIRRNSSFGMAPQMIGLANDAWRMNMDSVQTNDTCVLSPDYATLGHGEAMLRFGLRNALNSYVTGTEAEGRGALLAKAASEFRDCAINLADRLEKTPETREMAQRIRQTIDEILPPREGLVTTQSLAAIVSSSVFFSCDRGDFGLGNGFLRSVELSMIADEFRARPIFQLLFSATDEALGGNGCYSTVASSEGISRWLQAFAPDATELAKARSSAAFSRANPFISGLSIKAAFGDRTVTAADLASGSALQVATDLGVADGASYRVKAFNGKLVHREANGSVGGYLLELAQGAHRLAARYGEITGQTDVVLSAAQVFRMAADALGMQATEAGGDTTDTGTRASFRGIIAEDVSMARAYRAAASYEQRTTSEGISDSAKELFGHALRNIADVLRKQDPDGSKLKREVAEWLKSMAVPRAVVDEFVSAFDSVNENRKTIPGGTKDEAAKRLIDEDAELERENSTNDADHERRTAAFANDPDIRSLSEVLRYIFPFERGDSAPTVLRLREAFSNPDMYAGLKDQDAARLRNLFAIASNSQNFDDTVSADEHSRKVSEQHDAEFDALLRRVVSGLWENGHKDLSLALAAIVAIPAQDGRRGKLLSMLGQSFTVGSLELHEDAMATGFRIVPSGSHAGFGTVRTLMGVSYSSLLSSKVLEGFADPKTGKIKDVRVLARLIKSLTPQIFTLQDKDGDWAPDFELRVGASWSKERVDGNTIDASIDVSLLDALLRVMTAKDVSKVNQLDWYAKVEKAGEALREKMTKAADAVDKILGVGNQYSYMLRQPFTAGRVIQDAKSAINVKTQADRYERVYALVNLLNYFSAAKNTNKKFSTQDTQILPGSRFLNDVLREPVLGLYRSLGGVVNADMSEDDITAVLEKGLENLTVNRLSGYSQMDALRSRMQDLALLKSQRSDMHLDAGLSLTEVYKTLGVGFEPAIGSVKRTSPYATFLGAYLAGSPRTSATMTGRSATREESAKQKSVQTLPSALPGFVRFVNSPLFKVGGADTAFKNGYWSDGSRPVVSFVGAKIENGRTYERQALGGYVLQAIRDQFKNGIPSHVLFPFFRADKPACYAIQVPVGIVQSWVRTYWDAMENGDSDLLDALPPGVRNVLESAHEAAAKPVSRPSKKPGAWKIDMIGFSGGKLAFLQKDEAKFNYEGGVTKMIAFGRPGSSTEKYGAKDFKSVAVDGTGSTKYTADDVVGVSLNGNPSVAGSVLLSDPRYQKELANAIAAGATIIADNPANRERPYNVEQEGKLAEFLKAHGYSEDVREHGSVWTPAKPVNTKKSTGLSKDGFYNVAYALVASALGQSQIDPKRVPVLSSVGPYISGWANDGEKTDPRAGVYIVSTIGGTTGASLMGGYLSSGLLPTRIASYGDGAWSQAQKVHMFDSVNGVNFKKGQATSMGKTVAEQIGCYESGEVLTSNALRFAQAQMRRMYEKIAGLRNGVLDPVAPKADAQTDEEYNALVKEHDAAVAAVEELGKILTVTADDLETNKAGIFGSSCGLKPVGNQIVINGVVLAELENKKWRSRVDGFTFDWDGEGVKKGKALIAVALSAYAVATGGSFDAATIEGTWVKPDGSEFTGKLGDSGLLKPGEILNFSAEKGADFATMEFKTRSMHAQVVASNATSSKAEANHAFPTNATRDHWMIESIVNAMPLDAEGGVTGSDRKTRKPSRRFLDAHAGYSLLALASVNHADNEDLIYRALAGDEELAELFKKHPYDPELRDTYSAKIRAFITKASVVNFYGNHGVMVPSGFKITESDEFGHIVKTEEAQGVNDYDRGCYKPPVVYTTAQRAAFGCPRSYGSGSVNANVPGFRYGWYMDEEAFDALVDDIQIDESKISAFQLCGYEYGDCERLLKLEGYLRKHQGNPEAQRKLADVFFDYTGRHASGSAYAKSARFDDLFIEKDGELIFDYAAFDLDKRVDKDGERRLYLGGSVFHAHRSPSGNIAAASGTVRATCPRSYNAETGAVGPESAYALDPVTTHNQGSDMDGDSASLQFYDYECGDSIPFSVMQELTSLALNGGDVFQFAKEHGWTKTVSERDTDGHFAEHEIVDPMVLRRFARGVFLAQVLNYREMPVFHQGYANGLALPGGVNQDIADGSWFADGYASGALQLEHGYVFTDFGFAGRHPVGTDAVFAEPLTDASRERLVAPGIGTKSQSIIRETLAETDKDGSPKYETLKDVFEAIVSKVNGKPKQDMVVPEETAGMSDAASDSAKARGIGVSNQSLFTRALVTRFANLQTRGDSARATRAVDEDGYSPIIDLVAHLDGISNNLFDTLKKMFATGAGWTTSLLPYFIGRLVYNAPKYERLDSVFVLREAVSFLLEAKTEGTVLWNLDRILADRPNPDTIQRVAAVVRRAAEEWESDHPGLHASLPRSSDLKDWVDAFTRFSKFGYETIASDNDGNTLLEVRHEWFHSSEVEIARRMSTMKGADASAKLLDAVASASDAIRELSSGTDYMKMSGADIAKLDRVLDRGSETLNARVADQNTDADPERDELRLQQLVVNQMADAVSERTVTEDEVEQVVRGESAEQMYAPGFRSISTTRMSQQFASGSKFRDNLERMVHLVGFWRNTSDEVRKLAHRLSESRNEIVDLEARDASGKQTLEKKTEITRSTDNFISHLGSIVRQLSDRAIKDTKGVLGMLANREGARFLLANLTADSKGRISLTSKMSAADINALRAGFEALKASSVGFKVTVDNEPVTITGYQLAELLKISAALGDPFGVTKDYAGMSNLSAVFSESDLTDAESLYPEILGNPVLRELCGQSLTPGSRVYDLFGAFENGSQVVTKDLSREHRKALRKYLEQNGIGALRRVRVRGVPESATSVTKFSRLLPGGFESLDTTPAQLLGLTAGSLGFSHTLNGLSKRKYSGDRFLQKLTDYLTNKDRAVKLKSLKSKDGSHFVLTTGEKVPENSTNLVDPYVGSVLDTDLSFRDAEGNEILVFTTPRWREARVDKKTGKVIKPASLGFREDAEKTRSLEDAYHQFLADRIRIETADANIYRSALDYSDLNYGMRTKYGSDVGEVSRDLSRILVTAATQDSRVLEALASAGQYPIETGDELLDRAFAKARKEIERMQALQSATQAGDTMPIETGDTGTRASFVVRAEDMYPGFTKQEFASATEAIKAAFEAIPGTTVEPVNDKDGNPSNLLKVTRTVKGKKLVTYVSLGSRMGETLGVDAIASSLANAVGDWVSGVSAESLKARFGESALRRIGRLLSETGGQRGESVVSGFDFAPAMSGLIRLDASADFNTLFHEYYHQMVACYRKLGILDGTEEDRLNAELGGEEAAADAFARYLTGVENNTDTVKLREFVDPDGKMSDESHALMARFRTVSANIAQGLYRGDDEHGLPQFIRTKILEGDLTDEEAAKIVEPSAEDVKNLENELLGKESAPRTDILTAEQMTKLMDLRQALMMAIAMEDLETVNQSLDEAERILSTNPPREDTRRPRRVVVTDENSEPVKIVRASDAASVSAFIRKALDRYGDAAKSSDVSAYLEKFRRTPVGSDSAFDQADAKYIYTVRRFIRYVAGAEGIPMENEDGTLTESGKALLQNETVAELAMRLLDAATYEREMIEAERGRDEGPEFSSADFAFARAIEFLSPASYGSYCRKMAADSARQFRSLATAIRSNPAATEKDKAAAEDFERRADLIVRYTELAVTGGDFTHLLQGDFRPGEKPWGLLFRQFTGAARFDGNRPGQDGVLRYDRSAQHFTFLSTDGSVADPAIDLAYDYAAQALFVAMCGRSFRLQVEGIGKGDNWTNEEYAKSLGDPESLANKNPMTHAADMTDDAGQVVAQEISEALNLGTPAELAAGLARGPEWTDPAAFYSYTDTTDTTPEWILANEGSWLAADMMDTLGGVGLREMMTDHTIQAQTESKYRLAMDWVQFFGLDTHVGDGVRKVSFVESNLGRDANGDFNVSKNNAHTAMQFSQVNGCLFGILNWQEARHSKAITEEDWQNMHMVGRLVKLLATRDDRELTGISVDDLSSELLRETFTGDDWKTRYTPEAVLARRTSGEQMDAVDAVLLRMLDSVDKGLLFADPKADVASDTGVYGTLLRTLASEMKLSAGVRGPGLHARLVNALARAGVVHKGGAAKDRAVICITTDRMYQAWNSSGTKTMLQEAGRPPQMLNPYYWASKFSKAVRELNDAAAKSSYLSNGIGSMMSLAGTNQFWFHGGTGAHKAKVNAYRNAIEAFSGLVPSDTRVLEVKQSELFDILKNSRPETLRAKAFAPNGNSPLTQTELKYLATLIGATGRRDSAAFDTNAFAKRIARGALEVPVNGIRRTIRRDATVGDIRMMISDLVIEDIFASTVNKDNKQELFDQLTVAEMLRDRLTSEMPGTIVARSALQEFEATGRLGDSRTAAESLIQMCKDLTTAERFRGCLAQTLTSLSADGLPNYIVDPTDEMAAVNRMPDEYWGALAKHVIRFSRAEMPAYDAALSGVENLHRVYSWVAKNNKGEYGTLDVDRYGATRMFRGILCRLDDRDVAGNVNDLTRAQGGEAACYMKQLLGSLHAPTQTAAWRFIDRVTSWSKISSVGFSAFFQIATAFESPAAATGFLNALGGQAEWLGKAIRRATGEGSVYTRDVVRLLNSNDPFIAQARELCALIGMPLDPSVDFQNDPTDGNPVLGNAIGVKRDIEGLATLATTMGGANVGRAVRKVLEFGYKHPTDYTFNVVLNGVKLAVVVQTMRRLREECLAGNRPFDPVRELRKYAPYLNAEIGGIDPARYAWATPVMRKYLSAGMFSWQWTAGAWSAGGGEALTDMIFGGHSTNQEMRRHAYMRWLKMLGVVKFGVPFVLHGFIKLFSKVLMAVFPPPPDDEDGQQLAQEIEDMPWFAWENESKAGMMAFDVTPLLKLAGRVPGMKEAKRSEVPAWVGGLVGAAGGLALGRNLGSAAVGSAVGASLIPSVTSLIPAYVGGGRNTTGKRRYYMHFGKQSDEFFRWFEDPFAQLAAKTSIPIQKTIEGIYGRSASGVYAKGFGDLGMLERWTRLSMDPEQSALWNLVSGLGTSFSRQSVVSNPDAGFLAAVGPMRMGQSKRSTRLRIVSRLREFVEDDRTNNPWSYAKNRRKLNLLCTDILREAQVNGVDPSTILTSALGDLAKVQYLKLFQSFPASFDGSPDVRKMREAIRALTRCNRKYSAVKQNLVQKFRDAGTDVKKNPAMYKAALDVVHATQTSPMLFTDEAAAERFDAALTSSDRQAKATQLADKGGEGFANFLATDEVPETLFGVPIVTDGLSEDDTEFFRTHPEAGGFYDLGEK